MKKITNYSNRFKRRKTGDTVDFARLRYTTGKAVAAVNTRYKPTRGFAPRPPIIYKYKAAQMKILTLRVIKT